MTQGAAPTYGIGIDTGGDFCLGQFLRKQFGKGPFADSIAKEGVLKSESSKMHQSNIPGSCSAKRVSSEPYLYYDSLDA